MPGLLTLALLGCLVVALGGGAVWAKAWYPAVYWVAVGLPFSVVRVLISYGSVMDSCGLAVAPSRLRVLVVTAATRREVRPVPPRRVGEAVRRGHVPTNSAEIAKAPRLEEEDIEPYTIEEVQSLLVEASKLRNSARWVVALAIGLRQGEALGLHWEDVDLAAGYVRIRKNRLRPKYRHGCSSEPCGRKAGYCPRREQTRREHKSTKSRAGRRTVGLPDPLIKLLRHHQEEQVAERWRPAVTGKARVTSSPGSPGERPGCALGTCMSPGRCRGRSRSRSAMRSGSRPRATETESETEKR